MADSDQGPRDQNYAYQKLLHATYKELRSEADQIALEIGGRYEKMLSLIAGGALAVSITFIEKIAPTPVPLSRWLALVAWLLLGAAVVATLVAISGSQKAQQKKIENMDSEILQKLYPDDPQYRNVDSTSNPFVGKVKVANGFSLYCAIFGLLSLIAFVFVNFPTQKTNEQQATAKCTAAPATSASVSSQLLHPDEKPSGSTAAPATTAVVASEKGELTMSAKPNLQNPPPPPPKNTGPLTKSYVPTKNPVSPPPPPQTPPPKKGN